MARFIVVPQWQGSPSTRAMALIDGADAILGDLPSAASTRIEVPYEAGESLETGVLRASTLRRIFRQLTEELEGFGASERLLVIGGDGGVAVPAIGHAASDDTAVVWFDAHAALHSPDTSPTGAYEGMALRAALGDGAEGLTLPRGSVAPERVVLAGARAVDEAEQDYIDASGIQTLAGTSDLDVASAVARTGASRVFVHVDLDVLDPAHIAGVSDAQPFGLAPAALIEEIAALRERFDLVGASLTGFAPHAPADAVEDLGVILRLIGALAKA